MDGETYEQWVAGIDIDTGRKKGRVRDDANALRFVEVTVNGPKTWSLAAALHPEISAALDEAQDKAAAEIVGWVAQHATTRVGPRGRQVQVPVEKIEAAVIRHYTSRAGDPHRHLHLQVNARVCAAGAWRGLHSVGIRDIIEAINGIGHAAVATDPRFRSVLAAHGFTLDPETSEIRAARAVRRCVQRPDHADPPQRRPLRSRVAERASRRGAGSAAARGVGPASVGTMPDPTRSSRPDGRELVARWNAELRELGYRDPTALCAVAGTRPGWIDRDAAAELVVSILGAKRSAWNAADIRGKIEVLLAQTCLLADPAARIELAEDITARAADRCVTLLHRAMCPSMSGR